MKNFARIMIVIHYIGWVSLNCVILWVIVDIVIEAMSGMFTNQMVGKVIGYAAIIHMMALVSLIGRREIKEWRKIVNE